MVSTIFKMTRDEAIYMARASERIGRFAEEVPCPRCGKPLFLEEEGTSYSVVCSGNDCIRADFRGI